MLELGPADRMPVPAATAEELIAQAKGKDAKGKDTAAQGSKK